MLNVTNTDVIFRDSDLLWSDFNQDYAAAAANNNNNNNNRITLSQYC
jgi:hypothetical protein